jgi:hypothetical protein
MEGRVGRKGDRQIMPDPYQNPQYATNSDKLFNLSKTGVYYAP